MDNKFKTIGYKELDTLLTDIGLHVYYKKNQCVLEYFGEQFNLDEVLNINGNYHYILRVNYKECNGNAVIVIKQLNNFGSEGKYASIIKYKDKVMCIKDTLSIPLNDSILVVGDDVMVIGDKVERFKYSLNSKMVYNRRVILNHLTETVVGNKNNNDFSTLYRLDGLVALSNDYYINLNSGLIFLDNELIFDMKREGKSYDVMGMTLYLEINKDGVTIR